MARLRERQTGSVVNVPDEKVAQVLALGHYDLQDEGSKAGTKKAAAKKSE